MRVKDDRLRNLIAVWNPKTNKVYYGFRLATEDQLDWWAKISHSLREGNKSKLIQSIRDYGIENHKWSIIEQYTSYAAGEEHLAMLIREAGKDSLNGK